MARFSAFIISLIGIALILAGVYLAILGGSWYYLICGLAMLATGVALYRHRSSALYIYAAVIAGTLIWVFYEVGFDWWQLAPRGGVIVLIGFWLIAPWITGRLREDDGLDDRERLSRQRARPDRRAHCVDRGCRLCDADALERSGGKPACGKRYAASTRMSAGIAAGDWPYYGRTPGGDRYSPLDQITPDNVGQLTKAWTYHTGDIRGPADTGETTYEVTPIKVGDTLYLCTPHNIAIALDAVDRQGEMALRSEGRPRASSASTRPAAASPITRCRMRRRARLAPSASFCRPPMPALIALDATTGQVCPAFGQNGAVDLWANMPNHSAGAYYSTSPPVIARDLIIVGGAVNDNFSTTEPSGVIRAYDAETGAAGLELR